MSRKPIRGLFFYHMEVDHTTNKRVRLLLNDYDSDGYWIWSCLIAHAYRTEGYFLNTAADDIDLFCADICRKPPELVYKVIDSCLKRGLFDKRIFTKFGILTSDRMQVTFLNGTKERRRKGTNVLMSKAHFLISPRDLREVADSFLSRIIFTDVGHSLAEDEIYSSAELNLFSADKVQSSAEHKDSSAPLPRKKAIVPRSEKRREENTNTTDTNVSVEAPEKIDTGTEESKKIPEPQGSRKNEEEGKKKKPSAKKKKDPEGEPYWKSLVSIYFAFCQDKFHDKPSFDGSDPSEMHRIIETLKTRAADQGKEWTESHAKSSWRGFLGVAYMDDWLKSNWQLSHLNRFKDSKVFLRIKQTNGNGTKTDIGITTSKNGRNGKPNSGDERINAIAKWGLHKVPGTSEGEKDS